jgi:hypothetical protein
LKIFYMNDTSSITVIYHAMSDCIEYHFFFMLMHINWVFCKCQLTFKQS